MMKSTIQSLIAEGKTKQAIDALHSFAQSTPDAELQNNITLLSGRFRELEARKHARTITDDAYNAERVRINEAILHYAEEMPDTEIISSTTNNNNNNQNNMNSSIQKAIWRTVLIAVIGIVIGFLGELMPDDIKTKIGVWTVTYLNISYNKAWLIITIATIIIFLYLVWKEAIQNNQEQNSDQQNNSTRNINQYGDKSIYVEKNTGDITIN